MADEIEADMDEQTVYTINSSINYPAIRGEEEAPIKEVVQTREAYTDENDTEKKEPKPVLCDGFKCVISWSLSCQLHFHVVYVTLDGIGWDGMES